VYAYGDGASEVPALGITGIVECVEKDVCYACMICSLLVWIAL